jgi:DNA-directed RNA polymerase subunit M
MPLGRGVEVGRSTPAAREVAVVETRTPTLPKAEETCPKCANGEAYWVLRQTRGADEPETRIFECTKCGHKWREYQ